MKADHRRHEAYAELRGVFLARCRSRHWEADGFSLSLYRQALRDMATAVRVGDAIEAMRAERLEGIAHEAPTTRKAV